jgi:hypothetical protein
LDTSNYIINDLAPFDIGAPLSEVKKAFRALTYSHVPITRAGVYAGTLSKTDTLCLDSAQTIDEVAYVLTPFFVALETNWLDIIEAFAKHQTNIMPVLDQQHNYVGYYELADIMDLFNHTPFLSESGGILVVEKGSHDYSFSEICQIIESNDGRIYGMFISKIDSDLTQATIKIGHHGIAPICQTFRRYGYHVVATHDQDTAQQELQARSQYLDKYLNI